MKSQFKSPRKSEGKPVTPKTIRTNPKLSPQRAVPASKTPARPLPLQEQIRHLLHQNPHKPFTKGDLRRLLKIPMSERESIRPALENLLSQHAVVKNGRHWTAFTLPKTDQAKRDPQSKSPLEKTQAPFSKPTTRALTPSLPQGQTLAKMEFTRDGRPKASLLSPYQDRHFQGKPGDWITIPSGLEKLTLPGDTVIVQVESKTKLRGDRETIARVLEIVERAHKPLAGTLRFENKAWVFQPDEAWAPGKVTLRPRHETSSPPPIKLPDPPSPQNPDQRAWRAIAVVDQWQNAWKPAIGHLTEILGRAGDSGIEFRELIAKHQLRSEFPESVLNQVATLEPKAEDYHKNRVDFRDVFTLTIDPKDARDFDDAISLSRDPETGHWDLLVHIADVSHFVQPGTPLDQEARQRGNSTYLPHMVLPMLPETLSNGWCSLRPREDKLTVSASIRIDPKGKVLHAQFQRSTIHSNARLTYEEAQEILDQAVNQEDPISVFLHDSWTLASLLRKKRRQHGAMEMEMDEVKVRCQPDGVPIGIEKVLHTPSHQLIEEFMLVANECAANTLYQKKLGGIYRIHDTPDEDKIAIFYELVKLHGHHLENTHGLNGAALGKFLEGLRGQPEEHTLKVALLRSLPRALYTNYPSPHWGLAKTRYTHFTSPIRRYADLIVHRALLKEKELNQVKFPHEMAEHLSATERNSANAEQDATLWKLFEWYEAQFSSNPNAVYQARIHEVKRHGAMIELIESNLRGWLHSLPLNTAHLNRKTSKQKKQGKSIQETHPIQFKSVIEVSIQSIDVKGRRIDFKLSKNS